MKQEFTFEEAFKIQEEHISKWAIVLNSEAYVRLIGKVLDRNRRGYRKPDNVARGTTLDQYVADIIMEMDEEKVLAERKRLYNNVHNIEG